MCIIVDTNKIGRFLNERDHEDEKPIHKWLRGGNGRLVCSTDGMFGDELSRKAKTLLQEWGNSGMARLVPSGRFCHFEKMLEDGEECVSKDFHVLALARYSGARVLYTGDKDLIKDFKNRKIIPGKTGKIYSSKRNKRLLTRSC